MSPPFYTNAYSSCAINDTTRAYASLCKLTAAFGQTLLGRFYNRVSRKS